MYRYLSLSPFGKKLKSVMYSKSSRYIIAPLVLLSIFCASNGFGDEETSFLCSAQLAVGFKMNSSGQWDNATFNVDGHKYILKPQKGTWYWQVVGDLYTKPLQCTSSVNGFLQCEGSFGEETLFNKNTLRFQLISKVGYVKSDLFDENRLNEKSAYTPFYEIGTCSPF